MSRLRKAISPVIATIILVAVVVVVSVAAGYWISGTTAQYSSVEKISIDSAYCTIDSSVNNSRWRISVTIHNTGSTPSKISYIMVNNKLVDEYNIIAGGSLSAVDVIGTSVPSDGLSLSSGETATVYIWIGSGLLSSGTSVNIDLLSLSGVNYFLTVKLV